MTENSCYNAYSEIEKLFERQLLLMGGNAFKQLDVRRIKRVDIDSTLRYVSQHLSGTGMTFEYMKENLMGSAGKQADSGDLDVAVDEDKFNKKTLSTIAQATRSHLGDDIYANTKTLKGGQIQTAWPINGNPAEGYVQVDFIIGKLEWLKFSHWSPGKDNSPYKGVWISALFRCTS